MLLISEQQSTYPLVLLLSSGGKKTGKALASEATAIHSFLRADQILRYFGAFYD